MHFRVLINDVFWDFCGWCFGFASLKNVFHHQVHCCMEKCNRKWNGKILRDIFTFYGCFVSDSEDHRRRFFSACFCGSVTELPFTILTIVCSAGHKSSWWDFFLLFSGFKKAKTSSTNLIFCFRRSFTNFKCFMMSHFQARKSEKGSIKRHVKLELVLTHQCEIRLDFMQ